MKEAKEKLDEQRQNSPRGAPGPCNSGVVRDLVVSPVSCPLGKPLLEALDVDTAAAGYLVPDESLNMHSFNKHSSILFTDWRIDWVLWDSPKINQSWVLSILSSLVQSEDLYINLP